jgi:holo-[acyl-carrier protein] synthase
MLTSGVDLIRVARVARVLERYGERFHRRVFTAGEVEHARERPDEFATRFAAKEAASKALGVGMRMLHPEGVGWQEVEVLNDERGKPYLVLHGRAKELAEEQGYTQWSVSFTHDGEYALAFVVGM